MRRYIIKLSKEVDTPFYIKRVLRLPPSEVADIGFGLLRTSLAWRAMRRLRRTRPVEYIERDMRVGALWRNPKPSRFAEAVTLLHDESYDKARQWAKAKEAWAPHYGKADGSKGDRAVVGVIDTGIEFGHPDLIGAVIGEYNAITDSTHTLSGQDDNGHGTFVSGIIAARANKYGCVGIAPEAELFAIKVLDKDGRGWTSDIIKGLLFAAKHPKIDLVNMSLGGPFYSKAFHDAVKYASGIGLGMVAASGNDGYDNRVCYPGGYPEVICVAALNSLKHRASFSNAGSAVDIAACGEHVYSLGLNGTYRYGTGTSAATPVVSAVLAMTVDKFWGSRKWLYQGADDISPGGWNKYTGWGSINARGTLDELFAAATIE